MQRVKENNCLLLGKRVKSLRIKKSKSLNKFVFGKGGLTSATWSRIENGKVDVKFNTLIKVAAMLEINLDELLKNLDIDYSIEE